jgi:RecB family exonuclease
MDGALDAAVHRAFCDAVAAAADGHGIAPADLWASFQSCTVSPAARGSQGPVTVTSFEGMRGRTFDAVVIGGLTAGETPRQGSDDRLEGDAVRGALHSLGIEVDADAHARSERLSFYLAATAATRSLTLVRRETDDDGRPLRPSVFWEESLDLYRRPACGEQDVATPALRVREAGDEAGRAAVRRIRRGVLEDRAVLASLEDIRAVSPGEVELYAGCPYRWFVQRRLRPAGPDVEVDAVATGLAEHKALASFYRDWTADGSRARVTPELLDEALKSARAAVGLALSDVPAPTNLDEDWLLRTVEPAVQGLVLRDATFLPEYSPRHFEWSFGIAEGDEPIDLGGVAIKGRADRIDVGPEGLVVIDYKRSKASSRSEIEREGMVQLQLYALAASRRLGLPVAGGLYRSLSVPSDRGFVLDSVAGAFVGTDVTDSQGIEGLVERAVGTARAAFEGMRSGIIAPEPDARRCKYCHALSFCPEGVHS